MAHLTLTLTLTVLIVVLTSVLFPTPSSATYRFYSYCNANQRAYIEDRVQDATVAIEEVLLARGDSNGHYDGKLERSWSGILAGVPAEVMTEVYTAALMDPPNLTFTCPTRGSGLEQSCQKLFGAPDLSDPQTGSSFFSYGEAELYLCPASGEDAVLAYWNKVAIVSEVVNAKLLEHQGAWVDEDYAAAEL